MDEEIIKFRKFLFLKSQLLTQDFSELMDFYSDFGCYVDLVETVAYLLERETAFFMLDKRIIDDVLILLNTYRFTEQGKPYFEKVGKEIQRLNSLKANCKDPSVTDSGIRVLSYVNQIKRKKNYRSEKELVYDILNDFSVFEELYSGRFYGTSTETFVGSVNCFLSDFPFMFTNETIYNNCLNRLDEIRNNSKTSIKQKRSIKTTKERIVSAKIRIS